MPNQSPFPSREVDFNIYVLAVYVYLKANAERLRVSQEHLTLLTNIIDLWTVIFPQSQNLNTRTKDIVQNKDAAKKDLLQVLRLIYGDIPQSILTIEDRNALHLEARNAARTPAPVPHSRPVCLVNTSNRLEHVISFSDESGGHGKPVGVRGCQIYCKEGEPVKDITELTFLVTDTKSPFVYQFPVSKAGKTIHYWLRWENTRGEVGPWSNVVTATVTG